MATTLKHFKSDETGTATKILGVLSFAPTVQAIVVDGGSTATVNPQLASIVRVDTEAVMTSPEDSHAPCPTHSEIVTAAKTWPIATCVAIVHSVSPASHVGSATFQIRATTTLAEIERMFPEATMAIGAPSTGAPGAGTPGAGTMPTRTHNSPSVSCVDTSENEAHTC